MGNLQQIGAECDIAQWPGLDNTALFGEKIGIGKAFEQALLRAEPKADPFTCCNDTLLYIVVGNRQLRPRISEKLLSNGV